MIALVMYVVCQYALKNNLDSLQCLHYIYKNICYLLCYNTISISVLLQYFTMSLGNITFS